MFPIACDTWGSEVALIRATLQDYVCLFLEWFTLLVAHYVPCMFDRPSVHVLDTSSDYYRRSDDVFDLVLTCGRWLVPSIAATCASFSSAFLSFVNFFLNFGRCDGKVGHTVVGNGLYNFCSIFIILLFIPYGHFSPVIDFLLWCLLYHHNCCFFRRKSPHLKKSNQDEFHLVLLHPRYLTFLRKMKLLASYRDRSIYSASNHVLPTSTEGYILRE